MVKFIKIQLVESLVPVVFGFTGSSLSYRIVKGLPEDAELAHVQHDYSKRVWVFVFTSQTHGFDIHEYGSLDSIPVSTMEYQANA